MLYELSLYCLILHNFLKQLRNAMSEHWFISINVYISHKMSLATCFVSLPNINDV